jgi:MFS family permease
MYTEPLWGIPFNLYTPFASVYMIALGLTDRTIGLIASVGLALQMVFSLLGGPITDKLGRKRATFIFDIIAWSIPTLVWAFARNATWFYIAAIFNSVLQITTTSWVCLFIEDAPSNKIVHYWTWAHVAAIVAGFVAPLTGLFIDRFELIPTMRVIYLFAFVAMTAKFVILNVIATETRQGTVRLAETRTVPFLSLVRESLVMFRRVFTSPGMVAVLIVLTMNAIYNTVRGVFFAVLLTRDLGFGAEEIGWFPALRALVMLLFFFAVLPRMEQERHVRYLIAGSMATVIGTVILIVSPARNYPVVIISTIVEAVGAAILAPYIQGFVTATVDPHERARLLAVANTVVLAVSSPFGWIGGILSERAEVLPFVMIAAVTAAAGLFLLVRNPERPR